MSYKTVKRQHRHEWWPRLLLRLGCSRLVGGRHRLRSRSRGPGFSKTDIRIFNETAQVLILIALPLKVGVTGSGPARWEDTDTRREDVIRQVRPYQVNPFTQQVVSPRAEWNSHSSDIRILVATKDQSEVHVWTQRTVQSGTDVFLFPELLGPGGIPLMGSFPLSSSAVSAALSAILPQNVLPRMHERSG